MFTGIVEEVGAVAQVTDTGLRIEAVTALDGSRLGDSIAINGACLTITSIDPNGSANRGTFTVDVVPETRRRTGLGELRVGDLVNLERSLPAGGRMGGHFVQGHVDGTGTIHRVDLDGEATMVQIEASRDLLRYVVEKGFITIDGISLTVVSFDRRSFSVALIPFTRAQTNFRSRKIGDTVNLEVDVLAKYVERFLGHERLLDLGPDSKEQ